MFLFQLISQRTPASSKTLEKMQIEDFSLNKLSPDQYRLKSGSVSGPAISIVANQTSKVLVDGKETDRVVAVTGKNSNVSYLYKEAGRDYWNVASEVQIKSAGKSHSQYMPCPRISTGSKTEALRGQA